MKSPSKLLLAALVLLIIAILLWRWQPWRDTAPSATTPAAAVAPPPAQEPASAASAPPSATSAVQFPVGPASAAAPSEPAPVAHTDAGVQAALVDLAGRKGVLSFLQLDGFVRRIVATVDNLDRPSAPARIWPVNPTAGKFEVRDGPGGESIDLDNALRYAPLLQFIEAVDLPKAVALYRQLYPWFQQTYQDLGYPQGYFNDRLVAVIDHLLQAPEPEPPVAVTLTEIKGPIPSARPWVHYEFADPALAQASAGQKIMMRVGLVNERRLKTKLRELRQLLTQRS